jgi:hypothetical protein
METKHTPTPWTYEPQPFRPESIWAGTKLIAQVVGDSAETEGNAAFIVCAVNVHDELLYVVEQFVNGAFTNAITSEHDETFERLLAKAHHVLAKSRGEA